MPKSRLLCVFSFPSLHCRLIVLTLMTAQEAEYEDLQYQEARNPPAQHRTSEDDQRPYVRNATDPLEPRAPTPPPKDDKYTGSQPSSPESPRSTRKMPWFKKKSQTYSLAKGAAGEGGYRRAKRYFGEEYV